MPNRSVKKFEDLEVWKESMNLACDLITYLKDCKHYGIKDQMERSALSIPSNISEGYERESNKEFIRFLYIAKASCGELRTQLYVSIRTGLIDKETGNDFLARTKVVSSKLYSYINTRKNRF